MQTSEYRLMKNVCTVVITVGEKKNIRKPVNYYTLKP